MPRAMGFERKRIAEMHGYVPGKQPAGSDTDAAGTAEVASPKPELFFSRRGKTR